MMLPASTVRGGCSVWGAVVPFVALLAAAPAVAFEMPGGNPSPFDLKRWTTETSSIGVNRYLCKPPRCSPPGSASFAILPDRGRAAEACKLDFLSYSKSQDGSVSRQSYFEPQQGIQVRTATPLRTRVYSFASLSSGRTCGLLVMLKYAGNPQFYQIRIVYRGGKRYSVDGTGMTQEQARQNEATLSRALGLIR